MFLGTPSARNSRLFYRSTNEMSSAHLLLLHRSASQTFSSSFSTSQVEKTINMASYFSSRVAVSRSISKSADSKYARSSWAIRSCLLTPVDSRTARPAPPRRREFFPLPLCLLPRFRVSVTVDWPFDDLLLLDLVVLLVLLVLFVEHSQSHCGVGLDEGAAEGEPSSFLGGISFG